MEVRKIFGGVSFGVPQAVGPMVALLYIAFHTYVYEYVGCVLAHHLVS